MNFMILLHNKQFVPIRHELLTDPLSLHHPVFLNAFHYQPNRATTHAMIDFDHVFE